MQLLCVAMLAPAPTISACNRRAVCEAPEKVNRCSEALTLAVKLEYMLLVCPLVTSCTCQILAHSTNAAYHSEIPEHPLFPIPIRKSLLVKLTEVSRPAPPSRRQMEDHGWPEAARRPRGVSAQARQLSCVGRSRPFRGVHNAAEARADSDNCAGLTMSRSSDHWQKPKLVCCVVCSGPRADRKTNTDKV